MVSSISHSKPREGTSAHFDIQFCSDGLDKDQLSCKFIDYDNHRTVTQYVELSLKYWKDFYNQIDELSNMVEKEARYSSTGVKVTFSKDFMEYAGDISIIIEHNLFRQIIANEGFERIKKKYPNH